MKKTLALVMVLVFAFTALAYAAPANSFVDVPANDPAYADVQALIKAGLVTGVDGKFDGSKPVTRYEMASVVAKLLKNANQANAKDLERIQRLAVEFQAQLEEMDVRVTNIETAGKKALDWFKPTMPKWSGEFNIAYNDGAKNYFSPYVSGTGAHMSNQSNSVEFDLNFEGKFATAYDIGYHGGFAMTYNYTQSPSTADGNSHGLTVLDQTFNGSNSEIYIDGDLPGVTDATSALYGTKTTFAAGRFGYAPGAGFAVDSTMNGAKMSNAFANGLTVTLFCGLDNSQLAYSGSYEKVDDPSKPLKKGEFNYGAIIRPTNNKDINGENFFNMYGQKNTATDKTTGNMWTGYTGYTAVASAIAASYPIGPWTLKGGWSAVTLTNGGSRIPVVGQKFDARTGEAWDPSNPGNGYDEITNVTGLGTVNSFDAGILYDDGYWHGNTKFAYSPTYDGYNTAKMQQYYNNVISVNTGITAEVHAGTTDSNKPWTYDAFLKYSNVGPLMSYAPSATTIGLGGTMYKVGCNFVPMKGTLWENNIAVVEAALNSSVGSAQAAAPYQNSTVFATKLHFYF